MSTDPVFHHLQSCARMIHCRQCKLAVQTTRPSIGAQTVVSADIGARRRSVHAHVMHPSRFLSVHLRDGEDPSCRCGSAETGSTRVHGELIGTTAL